MPTATRVIANRLASALWAVEKVFEVYIKTTPERLWEAITDPEIRARYQWILSGLTEPGQLRCHRKLAS